MERVEHTYADLIACACRITHAFSGIPEFSVTLLRNRIIVTYNRDYLDLLCIRIVRYNFLQCWIMAIGVSPCRCSVAATHIHINSGIFRRWRNDYLLMCRYRLFVNVQIVTVQIIIYSTIEFALVYVTRVDRLTSSLGRSSKSSKFPKICSREHYILSLIFNMNKRFILSFLLY